LELVWVGRGAVRRAQGVLEHLHEGQHDEHARGGPGAAHEVVDQHLAAVEVEDYGLVGALLGLQVRLALPARPAARAARPPD
jgi:hypothetical protein